jgi:hypothetical protein
VGQSIFLREVTVGFSSSLISLQNDVSVKKIILINIELIPYSIYVCQPTEVRHHMEAPQK